MAHVRRLAGSGVKRKLAREEVDGEDLGHVRKKFKPAHWRRERPRGRSSSPLAFVHPSRRVACRIVSHTRWKKEQPHLLRKFALHNWSRRRRRSVPPAHHVEPFSAIINSDELDDVDEGSADGVCSVAPATKTIREAMPPSLGPSNYQGIDDEDDPFDFDDDLWPPDERQSGYHEVIPNLHSKARYGAAHS